MIYKGKGGKQYNLGGRIAGGGEGDIFTVAGNSDIAAKIYKPGKAAPDREAKLIQMISFPPDKSTLSQIAWAQDILYDSAGQFAGFIMPKLNVKEDLNIIYEYGASAKYPNMLWMNRIIIAENLCAVLDSVHKAGHACGDFNPKNISVNPHTGFVVLLDTDSYHIQDGAATYRCNVGIPEYLPKEIQAKMRGGTNLAAAPLPTFSQDTDNFALAIHIFQLLMNGAHPFACAVIPTRQTSVTAPQPADNIIKGYFPYMQNLPGINIPRYAPKIDILPKNLQNLFKRAFINGHRNPKARPKPAEWHGALHGLRTQLTTCGKVHHHQYYNALPSCPWCEADAKYNAPIIFPPTASTSLIQTTVTKPSATPKPVVPKPPKPAKAPRKSLRDMLPSRPKIEAAAAKTLFRAITLFISVNICLAAFTYAVPFLSGFVSVPAEYALYGLVRSIVAVSPYLLFASGMGSVLIYNKRAIKYNNISWQDCFKSTWRCITGHIKMAMLIAGVIVLTVFLLPYLLEVIPPFIGIITGTAIFGALVFGTLNWFLRIFINPKIAGLITLAAAVFLIAGVFGGWFGETPVLKDISSLVSQIPETFGERKESGVIDDGGVWDNPESEAGDGEIMQNSRKYE